MLQFTPDKMAHDEIWRHGYMTWTQMQNEIENKGKEEGMDLLSELYNKLEGVNRISDYSKAMKDRDYLLELLKEFNLDNQTC